MTIRAKLYAAIALTILGPLATIAVALHGQAQLGDSFDEVQERARGESLARQIKFDVSEVNSWQTAYGYDGGGRFRVVYLEREKALERNLAEATATLTDPTNRSVISQLEQAFDRFKRLDDIAYRAQLAGDGAETKRILLGPELRLFEAMSASAERLADHEAERADAADAAFDADREAARRRLIAVALGAGMVIILLLVTAQDVARLALEGERKAGGGRSRQGGTDGPS